MTVLRRWLVDRRQPLTSGPQVVAIGGGRGLSTLLRGLKETSASITAVVTVADDGGSSGKLRADFGLPPMGDIRNCIEALADAEPTMRRLLGYRFPTNHTNGASGADGKSGSNGDLGGHALGNLLIAALTDITGDFEEAVRQSNRVLAVRGSVVPVAGVPINLHAELTDGRTLDGQSRIARAKDIRRVWITPAEITPTADALAAIAGADLAVIGPGSLYTSLLPPLLVPGIHEALARTRAPRVFVCNVATQLGETEGYGLAAHLAAFDAHGLGDVIDAVIANDNQAARQPLNYPAAPVRIDLDATAAGRPPIHRRDVVDIDNAHRHDPHKLATSVMEIHERAMVGR